MTTISESLLQGNRFFIYRQNGIEVSFNIIENKPAPTHELYPQERHFIRDNYLKKNIIKLRSGHQYFESKMNKL